MNESELRDFLPPERPVPPARRHEMKERLMATIESEGTVRRVRSRLPVPGAAVAAGVVALAFAAGAVAIMWNQEGESVVASDPKDADSIGPAAPSEDTATTAPSVVLPERDRTKPDPEDVAQVMENYEVAFESHGPGWRPELHAEQMICATPEDEAVDIAYRFPMQDAIERDDYIHSCSQSDWLRNEGVTTEGAEVCLLDEDSGEGYFGPDYTGGEYPVAFVALAGRSCTDEGMQLITDEDLAEINRLRAIEASIRAAPECSTFEAVERWAQAWLDEEGIDFPIHTSEEAENTGDGVLGIVKADRPAGDQADTSEEETAGDVCYSAVIEWQLGGVVVALYG